MLLLLCDEVCPSTTDNWPCVYSTVCCAHLCAIHCWTDRWCRYFAQLHFIQGRFPISKDAVRIDFDWCDAFSTEIHVKVANLLWEKVAVMWNMATLQNNVGTGLDRSRAEGAKAAASHCAMAAGMFDFILKISNDFQEERTRDISPPLLNLMREICIANAQSCAYDGARVKGVADALLARLAFATSQAYQRCSECV